MGYQTNVRFYMGSAIVCVMKSINLFSLALTAEFIKDVSISPGRSNTPALPLGKIDFSDYIHQSLIISPRRWRQMVCGYSWPESWSLQRVVSVAMNFFDCTLMTPRSYMSSNVITVPSAVVRHFSMEEECQTAYDLCLNMGEVSRVTVEIKNEALSRNRSNN